MSPTVKAFDELSTSELHALLRLRCDVFVVEQRCAYPEVDGRDLEPGTRHVWFGDGPEISAYLRVLAEPRGVVRIGRVVTNPAERGRGLAASLVRHITATTDAPVVLDAQTHLVDWYRRLGFEVAGDEFVEDGIPHVPMHRDRRATRPISG